MSVRPITFGIIGCGNISNAYLNAAKRFPIMTVKAVADIVLERAVAKAEEHNVPVACTPDELLADPDIEIVINLTIPAAHHNVCKAALEAGKHVHVEKPLSLTREEGLELVELAKAKGLRLGSAPDTFLGGGQQTCRKLIDDGWIGQPVAVTGFMMGRGPEGWHPNPDFFYQLGGGPMFDMGPYYLTAMVNLLGPIKRSTGSAQISYPERIAGHPDQAGRRIPVEIPTHIAGILDFAGGAVGTLITSFDVYANYLPNPITIYGSEGSLIVPDPNMFGGIVRYKSRHMKDFQDVPLTHGHTENDRGIGAADIAYAIQSGRPHRASGDLGYHVLEAMWSFHDASKQGKHYDMQSTVTRPAPLDPHLPDNQLDE